MSMSCAAILAPLIAPCTTSFGEPTNVYTVRFVDNPGSTSNNEQPSVLAMAWAIASTTSLFRPSEKFGTHSTIWAMIEKKEMIGWLKWPGTQQKKKVRWRMNVAV